MTIINNRLSKVLIISLTLWGIVSCASEEIPNVGEDRPPTETEILIPIKVPLTRTPPNENNDPENSINTVRMMILKAGIVRANTWLNTAKDSLHILIADSVPVGNVDFFLIANEASAWNLGTYGKNTSLSTADLEGKILNFSAYPTTGPMSITTPGLLENQKPIPMVRIYKNLQINQDGTAQYGPLLMDSTASDYDEHWGVKRLYAKLTFRLDVVFQDLVGGDPIKLDSIKVMRMPTQSYLGEKSYTLTSFFNGDTLNRNALPNTYAPTSKQGHGGFYASFTTYLPEYRVSTKDSFTYIAFYVNLAGSNSPTTHREYKVVIGDGIDKNGANMSNDSLLNDISLNSVYDYTIRRNTHYIYDAKLESYQHSSDIQLTLKPTVLPWNFSDSIDPVDVYENFLAVDPVNIIVPDGNLFHGTLNVYTDYKHGWNIRNLVSTASFNPTGGTENHTSGPFKFTYLGNSGSSVTFDITTGKNGKIKRSVKIYRP
jgi:hypothetical protein